MKEIIYKKDGIIVDEKLITLNEIIKNCNLVRIKEDKLLLFKMEWKGWRGFYEGILEEIILPLDKIEIIKKYILGKTINFGEIAGKHSEVYNTLDESDITIIYDAKEILEFVRSNPKGHKYNHSFLYTFSDRLQDGVYEDEISEEEKEEFLKCF